MSKIPENLLYTKDHEWVLLHDDGTATIGITDYAQESLGDVTFVEIPATGSSFATGEAFGVVESVKAASDLYMPLAGEVTETNEALEDAPETLNSDPYGEGWLLRIQLSETDRSHLLDAAAYAALV
jgi:glycine cleavage system H protein